MSDPAPLAKPKDAWPHAPVHKLNERGTFFVTARCYQRQHHFHTPLRREVLQRGLLSLAEQYGWQLEAWAVLANHYHFVGHSPEDVTTLPKMLGTLHEKTSTWLNRQDGTPGRKVWHNYREKQLYSQSLYFSVLHYTHQNPVHHKLVANALDYPTCSAAWFERAATPAQVKSVYAFRYNRLQLDDPPL